MAVTPEAVAEWVKRSCESQGLAVRVADPSTIAQVTRILRRGKPPTARLIKAAKSA